jgi:hypothetical protein
MSKGVDFISGDVCGTTPLMIAARLGLVENINLLLRGYLSRKKFKYFILSYSPLSIFSFLFFCFSLFCFVFVFVFVLSSCSLQTFLLFFRSLLENKEFQEKLAEYISQNINLPSAEEPDKADDKKGKGKRKGKGKGATPTKESEAKEQEQGGDGEGGEDAEKDDMEDDTDASKKKYVSCYFLSFSLFIP